MSFQPVNKRQKGPDGSPIARNDRGGAHQSQGSNSSSPPARANATIQHTATNTAHPSIRLTVKAPPSKLRQAISGSDLPPNPYQHVDSETPDPLPRPSRATRNPVKVVDPESDDEQEDDEDMDDQEDDAEGDDLDDDDDEEEEDDEDAEADEMDMDDPHPPPPVITAIPTSTKSKGKQKVDIAVSAPPLSRPLKPVEDNEIDDDEDLSDLEDEELLDEEDADEAEGSELDEEGATRDGTPDLTKLTRRQRAAYDETQEDEGSLMALSNEAQKKKHLTAEEISMRRAEMARRRKNLSEKRNEEEKMETINKLLKKQTPKRRTRTEIMAAQAAEAAEYEDEDGNRPKPNALFVRYVQNRDGTRIGVPEEWLDKDQPLGDALRPGWKGPKRPTMLIEEVA